MFVNIEYERVANRSGTALQKQSGEFDSHSALSLISVRN